MEKIQSGGKGLGIKPGHGFVVIVCFLAVLALFPPAAEATVQFVYPPRTGYMFNLTEDVLFNYTIQATDTEGDPIVFKDTSHDANVSFYCFAKYEINSSASLINFTPTNKYVGLYSFELDARDSNDEIDAIVVYFNVTNVNDAPVLVSYLPYNASNATIIDEEGFSDLSIIVRDDDIRHGDLLNFTWSLDGIDSSMTEKLNATAANASMQLARYAPSIRSFDSGIHNVTVIVHDMSGAGFSHTWLIYVENVNRAPHFNTTIGNITMEEDTANFTNNFSLMDHFYDEDTSFDNLTGFYTDPDTGKNLSFGYELLNGTPGALNISFTPQGNVSVTPKPDWFGIWIVRFNVSDGIQRNYSNAVMINVTNVPDAPIVNPIQNQSPHAHANFTYHVEATDLDNDTLSYCINSTGPLANLSIDDSGIISLFPSQGSVGNYTVWVTVGDNTTNVTVSFGLEVLNNTIPHIKGFPGDNYSISQHIPSIVPFDGYDADGDNLTIWTNSSFLSFGSQYNRTRWNFSVLVDRQQDVGSVSVRAYAMDEWGAQSHYDFTFNILDTPLAPHLFGIQVPDDRIRIGVQFNITVFAFDEDADIDAFSDNTSLFDISLADSGSYSENASAIISFTPLATGYHHINISVNDSGGLRNSTLFILNITENHAPRFLSCSNLTCPQGLQCTYQLDADDDDWQDNLTFGFDVVNQSNSSNFNLDPLSGMIDFTPQVIETYYVDIWVSDGSLNDTKRILVNVTRVNNPPYFIPENLSSMHIWGNLSENVTSIFNISAYDIENETPSLSINLLRFTDLNGTVHTSGISLAGQFNPVRTVVEQKIILGNLRNVSIWEFNVTPGWDEVGEYLINISVTDNNTFRSEEFSFIVNNFNNPPKVNWTLYYDGMSVPENNARTFRMNVTENRSLSIYASAVDYDFDNLTYSWYRIKSNGKSSYLGNLTWIKGKVPFSASPYYTIMLVVMDEQNATRNITWTFNATNINRNVTFGLFNYEVNSSEGVYSNMEVRNGSLQLSRNGASYYSLGSYMSKVFDFQTYSHDIPRISYERIVINDKNNDSDHGIAVETAASREYADVLGLWDSTGPDGEILTNDYRYFSFRITANSSGNSTPNITRAKIYYEIYDLEVPANSEYAFWINLNHFFDDPDKDESLTYSYEVLSGEGAVNVSIELGYIVSLKFLSEGQAFIRFSASDEHNSTAYSNTVNITVTSNTDVEEKTTSAGGGGVSIRTQYKYKKVNVPVSLDIIHPDQVTVYDNDTVEIPIRLVNNENFNLKGLEISAFVDRPGVDLSISKTSIDDLPMNEEEEVILTLNMSEVYDSYGVYVNVNVTEPEYHDSAKIMISSLSRKGSSEDAQKMKFAFVKDLLSKNKECAELSEYIARAREALNDGDYQLADSLLEDFINDCKILIQDDKAEIEEPAPTTVTGYFQRFVRNQENLGVALTMISVVVLAVIFSIVLLYKKV